MGKMMEIGGKITEKDCVAANFVAQRPRPWVAILISLIICGWGVFSFIQAISRGWGVSLLVHAIFLPFCCLLGTGLFCWFVLIPYQAKKVYRSNRTISDPMTVTIKDDGLYLKGEEWNTVLRWSDIVKWRQGKNLVLVYSSIYLYYLFPLHFFKSGQDFEKFKSLVASKCGRSR